MNRDSRYNLVLAIYCNTRGFAFVLFEGRLSPFDWGLYEARGPRKDRKCETRVIEIISRYQPDVLVVRDTFIQKVRALRVGNLNAAICEAAKKRHIPIYSYSRD